MRGIHVGTATAIFYNHDLPAIVIIHEVFFWLRFSSNDILGLID